MIELASSIVSSTVATCIAYPAQRVKLQMHLDRNLNSTTQAIQRVYQKNGVRGFYTGLQSQIAGNGLSYAIYFVSYAKAKEIFKFNPNSLSSMIKSSGAAGCIASIATNPFWVLKTKQAETKSSLLKAGKQLVRSEGLLSLWKGLLASLILVSNPIIQFCIYEWLKKKKFANQNSPIYDLVIFIIGAISKIISTIITYPYTLIRTKQHVSKNINQSIWETFKDELHKNGVKGLYTGINAKIFQSVLNSALMLMVYERVHLTLTKLIAKGKTPS